MGSSFCVTSTAREGHTLTELETVIQAELDRIKSEPPTDREVQRAVNQREATFLRRLESVGGFGGKADQLNAYFTYTGNPDYFNEDLGRYRTVSGQDLSSVALSFLRDDARVILSIVPEGKTETAAVPQPKTE